MWSAAATYYYDGLGRRTLISFANGVNRAQVYSQAGQLLYALQLQAGVQLEKLKASTRAKVEHPFRVIKCHFGFVRVRYKGLAKNMAQLVTLFALSNMWMTRRTLMQEPRQGAPGLSAPETRAKAPKRSKTV